MFAVRVPGTHDLRSLNFLPFGLSLLTMNIVRRKCLQDPLFLASLHIPWNSYVENRLHNEMSSLLPAQEGRNADARSKLQVTEHIDELLSLAAGGTCCFASRTWTASGVSHSQARLPCLCNIHFGILCCQARRWSHSQLPEPRHEKGRGHACLEAH